MKTKKRQRVCMFTDAFIDIGSYIHHKELLL